MCDNRSRPETRGPIHLLQPAARKKRRLVQILVELEVPRPLRYATMSSGAGGWRALAREQFGCGSPIKEAHQTDCRNRQQRREDLQPVPAIAHVNTGKPIAIATSVHRRSKLNPLMAQRSQRAQKKKERQPRSCLERWRTVENRQRGLRTRRIGIYTEAI